MGRQATKRELFVSISLDEYVPDDHLLRAVDRYLDLSEFRANLADSYSHTGRPSIDPELMARMLIIGYCYGIRSERRLCEEVGMNLAYRWFCRLGLKDKVPDHSSFSKNRHGRFRDHDAFRQLFDSVLRRCMAEGLVQGEGFATDASMIKADAQRHRSCLENVLMENRSAAKAVETAANGGNVGDMMRHKGHDLPNGGSGRPHYQTDGKYGHTFWGTALATILSLDVAIKSFSEEVWADIKSDPVGAVFFIFGAGNNSNDSDKVPAGANRSGSPTGSVPLDTNYKCGVSCGTKGADELRNIQ